MIYDRHQNRKYDYQYRDTQLFPNKLLVNGWTTLPYQQKFCKIVIYKKLLKFILIKTGNSSSQQKPKSYQIKKNIT